MSTRSERKAAITKAFWEAVQTRGVTWDALASGMKIKFRFEGNSYEVQTGAGGSFRARSMDSYGRSLTQRALDAVGVTNDPAEPVDREKLAEIMAHAIENDPAAFTEELLKLLPDLSDAHLVDVFSETGNLTGRY